jgi:YesN/AraC family two-component response regulator
LLKETKYEVDCAGNGKEAIDLVKKAGFSYDIAFVDLIMPIMDGVETVKFFKKHSPATLIVMITGEADLSIVKKCYRAGAHMFWRKPFRIQNFIEDFRNLETASNALKEEYQEKQKLAKQPVYKKIPRKCKDFVRSIAQSNKKREVFYHIAVIIGFAMLYWAGMQVYQKIEDSVSHFTSRYDSVIDKIENYVEGLEWNKINTSNLMRQGLQNLQKDVYQKPSQLLNRSNDTNGFDEFPKRYNLLMDKMQNYIDNLPKVGEGLKGLDINKYYNIYPSEYLKRDGKRFYIELDEPMRRAIYSDTFPRR